MSETSGDGARPELPRRWKWMTLGEVAEVIRGVSYKKEQASIHPEPGLLPLIRATNIAHGLRLEQFVYVPEAVVKPNQRLQRNDIVVAVSSGSASVVGKAAQLTVSWVGTFGAFCAVVRPGPNINAQYLSWFMASDEYRKRMSLLAAGSNINNLKREHLLGVPIPIPPRRDQERIVAAIEHHLGNVDLGDGLLREALQKCEVLTRSTLGVAVADGEEHCVGDLLTGIEAGRSFRCHEHPAADDEWGVIKVSAMTWGEFDQDQNKAVLDDAAVDPRWEIRCGDLLLSRANTSEYVGASVLVGQVRPHLLLSDKSLRLNVAEGVDRAWLRFALNAPSLRAQMSELATGTSDSMRNLSQDKLRALRLRVPPLHEQESMAAGLASSLDLIRAAQGQVELVRRRARPLRQAVFAHYFHGRGISQPLTLTDA